MILFDTDNNSNFAKINSPELLSLIREQFSVVNPSFNRTKFNNKYTPRRLYAITPSGKFDIGLYGNIISFLKKENLLYSDNKSITDIYNPSLGCKEVHPLNLELRSYQAESINCCLNQGRGVVVLPTGAGKTLTIATLVNTINYYNNNYKFLIIVPTIQLIKQTYEDFISYGISADSISKWSGEDELNINSNIVVAGLQILQSQSDKYKAYLSSINVLIVDECHKLRKKNEFNEIVKLIDTPYKFGFTGTMPSELLDQWNVIGKLGPILYEKQSIELRDNNQIANIHIQILMFNYLNKPTLSTPNSFSPTKAYEEETEFIINSMLRNNKIASLCANLEKNTLIVCERISHGTLLYETLTRICTSKKVYFIQGSVDVEVREQIRTLMEREHNIICVAISKIFAEGINIKNLHYIVFASSSKAKVKILQTIGRGVRLHPLKTKLYIFDIADNLRYGNKHLKERLKLYETEKIKFKTSEIQI